MYKETLEHKTYKDNEVLLNMTAEHQAIWNETFMCRADMEEIFKNISPIAKTNDKTNTNTISLSKICDDALFTISSFLLAKVCECEHPSDISFGKLSNLGIDEDILSSATAYKIQDVWAELLQLTKKYDYGIFAIIVLQRNMSDFNLTPRGVSYLAINLLEIESDSTVAELCCGTGNVINAISEHFPSVRATGYEIDLNSIAVAKAQSEFEEKEIDYIKTDVFELVCKGSAIRKYDRIFANYPFGQRLRELNAGKEYLTSLTKKIPAMSKATSSDWTYNMLITEMLSEDGKAIGIMTNGSTWNMIDAPIRQYFVENGLIECVIALPAKLFSNTSIATSMIVFSHGNKGVRLVNASEKFTAGRRTNEITEVDMNAILSMISTDSENSFFVDTKTLRENDYVLNTNRYIVRDKTVGEGVAFDTVIERITRGAPLNARQLDELSSPIPTNMQYLMISNIQNGLIDSNLPYLTRIEKKNEKYCITDKCLILSKNGYPYKVAVAEVQEDQTIMANGNLYIIELNQEKVDPYYLAAYFSSENGIAVLKSITVGATIPNIGVEQLKKLTIPLPPIEEQRIIGEKYKSTRDEIKMLQLKLKKTQNRMMHIFEEEV